MQEVEALPASAAEPVFEAAWLPSEQALRFEAEAAAALGYLIQAMESPSMPVRSFEPRRLAAPDCSEQLEEAFSALARLSAVGQPVAQDYSGQVSSVLARPSEVEQPAAQECWALAAETFSVLARLSEVEQPAAQDCSLQVLAAQPPAAAEPDALVAVPLPAEIPRRAS